MSQITEMTGWQFENIYYVMHKNIKGQCVGPWGLTIALVFYGIVSLASGSAASACGPFLKGDRLE